MPRFSSPTSSRPIYYDRNPIDIDEFFQSGFIAPHAQTTRWDYTVPSDKKAFCELFAIQLIVEVIHSTPSGRTNTINYTPSGGAEVNMLRADLRAGSQTINDRNDKWIGATINLLEGDELLGVTLDLGIGGTSFYTNSVKLTEYDA